MDKTKILTKLQLGAILKVCEIFLKYLEGLRMSMTLTPFLKKLPPVMYSDTAKSVDFLGENLDLK